jgi:quercetin dioxygenase-like cupin family protein
MSDKIQIVHSGQVTDTKTGFNSRPIFMSETDQISEVRIRGGTTGGWHHHGKRSMYGFVMSGKLDVEFGQDKAALSAGDFFLIPAELVHRDVNTNEEEARIFIFSIGSGPATVEVSGPNSSS